MQIKHGLFSKKIFYTLLHLIYIYTRSFWLSGCVQTSGTATSRKAHPDATHQDTAHQDTTHPSTTQPGHNTDRRSTNGRTDGRNANTAARSQRIKDTQHLHPPRAYMHRLRRGRRDVCGRSEARGFRRDWGFSLRL